MTLFISGRHTERFEFLKFRTLEISVVKVDCILILFRLGLVSKQTISRQREKARPQVIIRRIIRQEQ